MENSRQASYAPIGMLVYTPISYVISVATLLFLPHTQGGIVSRLYQSPGAGKL